MKTLFAGLILLSVLAACSSLVQDVDPARLPQSDPQLVVHCYLSPQDTLLTAVVSRSRTSVGVLVDSTPFNPVPDARVTLSEGNRSIVLRFDAQQALYQADVRQFPIQAGRTYVLKVELPDGQRVTASSRVPASVPVPEVLLDSAANAESPIGIDYFVQLRWRDPAGEVNHYQAGGDNEYGSVERVYRANGTYVDSPYRATNAIWFQNYNESPFLTDEGRDGQVLTSTRRQVRFYSFQSWQTIRPPFWLNVYLLSVNDPYRGYHDMILNQARISDNPFAEPTLIRGNIEGGLGCFGAYNRATVRLRLR